MSTTQTLNIAFIGCGQITRIKHIPALKRLDYVHFYAFYDRNPEAAMEAVHISGSSDAKVVENIEDLFLDPKVDVVYICTPNRFHASLAIQALEHGKHVMCEKPMALNAKEAEDMYKAYLKSGKKLSISHQNRFRPDSLSLYEYCRQGELGDIYFAKAHALRRRAVPVHGMFFRRDMQGGGALIDLGCHALDLTLWMIDNYDVQSVTGSTFNLLGNKGGLANAWGPWQAEQMNEVEDSAFASIRMKNGSYISLECSWCLNIVQEPETRCTLCGTKAGADMLNGLTINGERHGRLYTSKLDIEPNSFKYYLGESESHQEKEARLFIECILNDTEPVVHPAQTLVVMKIMDAIYESARTGRTVYFDDATE